MICGESILFFQKAGGGIHRLFAARARRTGAERDQACSLTVWAVPLWVGKV